jgi:nickel superoxide dismutase
MRAFTTVGLGIALTLLFGVADVAAHCEVPCGIYGDDLRFSLIAEHVDTIEKAMNQIIEIEKQKPIAHHQLTRWIRTKEDHADKIQYIVSQYFLTQRIQKEAPHYEAKLKVLHQMLVFSMKCKQGTDLANVKKLRSLLGEFEKLYR